MKNIKFEYDVLVSNDRNKMTNLAKVSFFTEFSAQRKELRERWNQLTGVSWEEYLQAKDDEIMNSRKKQITQHFRHLESCQRP